MGRARALGPVWAPQGVVPSRLPDCSCFSRRSDGAVRLPSPAILGGPSSPRCRDVAPQPLELYTLVDGRHVDYRTIQPTATGQAFRIELAEITSADQTVRVELIHISSVWYAVELPIPRWQSE